MEQILGLIYFGKCCLVLLGIWLKGDAPTSKAALGEDLPPAVARQRGRCLRGMIASTFRGLAEALALCSRDSLIITIGINFPKLNEDKELQAPSVWNVRFDLSFSTGRRVSGTQAMPIGASMVQLGY